MSFTRSGYEVAVAPDGRIALDVLLEGNIPSLIVLDLNMPVMTGRELLAALRKTPLLSVIPTLIVSGETSRIPEPTKGTAFVAKPFETKAVLEAAERLLA